MCEVFFLRKSLLDRSARLASLLSLPVVPGITIETSSSWRGMSSYVQDAGEVVCWFASFLIAHPPFCSVNVGEHFGRISERGGVDRAMPGFRRPHVRRLGRGAIPLRLLYRLAPGRSRIRATWGQLPEFYSMSYGIFRALARSLTHGT